MKSSWLLLIASLSLIILGIGWVFFAIFTPLTFLSVYAGLIGIVIAFFAAISSKNLISFLVSLLLLAGNTFGLIQVYMLLRQ